MLGITTKVCLEYDKIDILGRCISAIILVIIYIKAISLALGLLPHMAVNLSGQSGDNISRRA